MVAVVQTNTDNFAHAAHRTAQAHALVHQRQPVHVDSGQRRQRARRHLGGADVGQQHRKITHTALGIQHTGTLCATRAISDEFHETSFGG
ncbi:hypothetical protein SDC9_169746 [bioreactor metagenome]|uniref:Uncharacterized protein n=1 Tax=bioreactor metagenome TaxID=1076179 RepID=A0A645GF03_9ZZZZ